MRRTNDTLGVWIALALVAIILAFIAGLTWPGASDAASCRTTGTAPFTAPDSRCTPGAFVRKTRADVCDGNTDRPTLSAPERRAILRNYGVPLFNGAAGELDHRIPLVFGGVTDRRNIWPEAEVAGQNPKDRLEFRIFRRVCFNDPRPMRVRTAIHVFQADWRAAYTYYVLGVGPRPTV